MARQGAVNLPRWFWSSCIALVLLAAVGFPTTASAAPSGSEPAVPEVGAAAADPHPTPTPADSVSPPSDSPPPIAAGEFDVYIQKITGVLDAFDGAATTSLMVAGVCALLGLLLMAALARMSPGGAIWQWFAIIAFVLAVEQLTLYVLTDRAVVSQAKELMMDDKEIIGVRVYSLEHSPYFDKPYRDQMRKAAADAAEKLPLIERFNKLAEEYRDHSWYRYRALRSGGTALGMALLALVLATVFSRRQIRR